jgi:hypothetical protein
MHVWKGCGGGAILFPLFLGLFDAFFLEVRLVVAIFYSFGIAVSTKLYKMNRGRACDFCDFSFVAAPASSTEIGARSRVLEIAKIASGLTSI